MRRLEKTTPAVMDLAAAAYDVHAELTNPAPDWVMRRIVIERLRVCVDALTTQERTMLAKRAGR